MAHPWVTFTLTAEQRRALNRLDEMQLRPDQNERLEQIKENERLRQQNRIRALRSGRAAELAKVG